MSEGATQVIKADALRDLMEQLLAAVGCDHEAAAITADVLLEADLRGYGTHGLIRLPTMLRRIQSGMINPQARPRVIAERAGTALVDADHALGPVGAIYGAQLAVQKARQSGICAGGVVNSDHICMAGYYAEHIARAGCVGILAGVTQPLVHPWGGVERVLGTNPLAIAIPTGKDEPVLVDFATSAIAFGTVLTAKVQGEPLPAGVAVGPDGSPTTDATAASQGALAPFGGHKGYGLGLVLGLLAGPLLGAKVGKALGQAVKDGHYDKGDLLIAIDPAAFGDPTVFRATVDAHLAEVKASKKAPGVETIRVPGKRGFAERAHRLREGVPVENSVWDQIAALAAELHVALPTRNQQQERD